MLWFIDMFINGGAPLRFGAVLFCPQVDDPDENTCSTFVSAFELIRVKRGGEQAVAWAAKVLGGDYCGCWVFCLRVCSFMRRLKKGENSAQYPWS